MGGEKPTVKPLRFALGLLMAATIALGGGAAAQAESLPTYKIRILPGSNLTLVANDGRIPIVIENGYEESIRVQVHIRPSNLRLNAPAATEVTVPGNTTFTAKVDVRAVADGEVDLVAWLTTFSGLRLGPSVKVHMTINAEVEGTLMTGFAIVVALLLAAGVIRTVRKRRQVGATV